MCLSPHLAVATLTGSSVRQATKPRRRVPDIFHPQFPLYHRSVNQRILKRRARRLDVEAKKQVPIVSDEPHELGSTTAKKERPQTAGATRPKKKVPFHRMGQRRSAVSVHTIERDGLATPGVDQGWASLMPQTVRRLEALEKERALQAKREREASELEKLRMRTKAMTEAELTTLRRPHGDPRLLLSIAAPHAREPRKRDTLPRHRVRPRSAVSRRKRKTSTLVDKHEASSHEARLQALLQRPFIHVRCVCTVPFVVFMC